MTRFVGAHVRRRIPLRLRAGFVLLALVFSGINSGAQGPPVRLRLRAERDTVRVGQTTKIAVQFLGRTYQPATNDRARTVDFRVEGLRPRPGSGELRPNRVTIPSGGSQDVEFVGRTVGTVAITASSVGMSSSRIVLRVVPYGSSLSLVPAAYAQKPITVEIQPKDNAPIPANGISRVSLFVTLDRTLEKGEQLVIRVQTVPGCKVLYKGEETHGLKQITIGEGNAQSDEIQLLSTLPGTVRVTARVVSGAGGQDQTDIRFESPRPTHIFFDSELQNIPSTQTVIPLTVRLADQDMVPITNIQRSYRILLFALSDTELVHFSHDSVPIDPAHPSAFSEMRLDGSPSSGQILLQARDANGVLVPTKEKAVTFATSVKSVRLVGPEEVSRGESRDLRVHFADAEHRLQRADWDRWIELTSTDGSIEPKRLQILKGGESTTVTFKAPHSVRAVSITAESSGLESGLFTIQVITPPYLLILFSGLGGMMGGFFRLTKEKISRILPQRVDGFVDFGLLINTAASFVFGLVIFQAVRIGLVALPAGISPNWGTRTVAFLFGVIGGYAGLAGLDSLAERFFGTKGQTKAQTAGQ